MGWQRPQRSKAMLNRKTITVITNSSMRQTKPISIIEGILRKRERSEGSRAPDNNKMGLERQREEMKLIWYMKRCKTYLLSQEKTLKAQRARYQQS